jgi:hypothetical protein
MPLPAERHRFAWYALAISLLSFAAAAPVSAQWRVEAWLGDALNSHSRMTISQTGHSDLSISPHWSTKPWEPTWYYAGRISKWSSNHAWALEYIHHKVYLENPPAEVEFFRITNGVNFWMAERLWRKRHWEFGVGGGPVWVVPISKVRGLEYNKANGIFGSQYELGGAVISANVTRRVKLIPWVYGILSVKGTAATLKARVAEGNASLMNYALHVNYGLSLQTKRDRPRS